MREFAVIERLVDLGFTLLECIVLLEDDLPLLSALSLPSETVGGLVFTLLPGILFRFFLGAGIIFSLLARLVGFFAS